MEQVAKFLKEADTYYLATVEGDQPRVRPFGTAHIFEGKLYIQTGKSKAVSKQIHANPKVEICAFKDGEWLRVAGELVEDDRREARQSMLDAYPSLQKMYSADDGNTEVFYFKNATVVGLLGGGAALYYVKFMKPKQNVKGSTDLDEFDFDEYDEDEPEEETDIADTEQEDEEE